KDAGPDGASCATVASRARAAKRISPPSSGRSPAMARNRGDLPAPLRPTSPMRRPGSTVRSAASSKVRPPRRMVAAEISRRDMADHLEYFAFQAIPRPALGWLAPAGEPVDLWAGPSY